MKNGGSLHAEVDVAETAAVSARPPAVGPRPHHDHVISVGIPALHRPVDMKRPHRVFGVKPAAHVEHRAVNVVHEFPQGTLFPVIVVVRVVDDFLPVAGLPVK
jgi:hypothetical protein